MTRCLRQTPEMHGPCGICEGCLNGLVFPNPLKEALEPIQALVAQWRAGKLKDMQLHTEADRCIAMYCSEELDAALRGDPLPTAGAYEVKQYLGDGVYIEFDGYSLVLTTENGISTTNRIVLEPEVYDALLFYVEAIKGESLKRN